VQGRLGMNRGAGGWNFDSCRHQPKQHNSMLCRLCRYLIAAGDPLQLPPVVASPVHVTAAPSMPGRGPPALPGQGQQGQLQGLLRPLFVRLAALGLPPFLLRRQYRCAERSISSRHGYGQVGAAVLLLRLVGLLADTWHAASTPLPTPALALQVPPGHLCRAQRPVLRRPPH